MKKDVLLSTSLICLITSLSLPSLAAIKPGTTCSSVGATKSSSGKKYTCIKSGKKLIWNKGVVIKKPKPIVTASPLPSATQSSEIPTTPIPATTATTLSPPPFQISGPEGLLIAESCKLADSTGIPSRLGFPIEPVIRDLSKISILAIPFEFIDSDGHRLSADQTTQMFESITQYFYRESYGKTMLTFSFPPSNDKSREVQALSLGVMAKDSALTKPFSRIDFTEYIKLLLSKTSPTWKIGEYDAVVLYSQDTRTFNFLGGQAWRASENLRPGFLAFDSPSGKIKSLVFGSAITTVMIHELGHSLLGLIDLYDENAGQYFAKGWGLMAAAYTGELNLRGWEKWLAGWVSAKEVRCAKVNSTHYLEFIGNKSDEPKLLIHPLDNQKAIVVEVINTNLIAREINGSPVYCDVHFSCRTELKSGLLAYTVDVNKLDRIGAIVVPDDLKFPNLVLANDEITVAGIGLKNLGCDNRGCYVSVGR